MPAARQTKNPISFAELFCPQRMRLFFNYNLVFTREKSLIHDTIRLNGFSNFFFGISGKIKWIREESLADIALVEMVDLPLADSEGSIEKQLKSDNGMFDMIFDSAV